MKSSPSTFPGEHFLIHRPPNYAHEWNKIMFYVAFLTTFMVFVVPIIAKSIFSPARKGCESNESKTNLLKSDTNSKQTRKVQKKNGRRTKASIKNLDTEKDGVSSITEEIRIPSFFFPVVNLIFFLALFMVICLSPNNSYSARHVYVAPLLKEEECNEMIEMANHAAYKNVENVRKKLETLPELSEKEKKKADKILSNPAGWSKDRHSNYPTTDLNVVVAFSKEDKLKLKKLLDARLSPLLEKLYGVPAEAIRAQDMFVVRYDGDGQQKLAAHTDASHISFNVLLNKDFTGGGTRFYNALEQTFEDVHLNPGEVVINNAMVTHEGLPTTKGTRYIFVGFMHVDRMNPWNGARNSLNLFSSWLSFPWLTVTIKEGLLVSGIKDKDGGNLTGNRNVKTKLSENKYVNKILQQMMIYSSVIGDLFAEHGVVKLVDPRNYDKYILTLDNELERRGKDSTGAEWFAGQQIYVGFDGRFHSEWSSRIGDRDKFYDMQEL